MLSYLPGVRRNYLGIPRILGTFVQQTTMNICNRSGSQKIFAKLTISCVR